MNFRSRFAVLLFLGMELGSRRGFAWMQTIESWCLMVYTALMKLRSTQFERPSSVVVPVFFTCEQ